MLHNDELARPGTGCFYGLILVTPFWVAVIVAIVLIVRR